MTLEETRQLILLLKDSGVIYYKDSDLELKLVEPKMIKDIGAPDPPMTPLERADMPKEIKHKIEEFTSLMKLNDSDLIDQLFPEPTEEEESA